MKTQISYKFSEKFWKKVQETFNIQNLLETRPKKAEKLYELDPDDMNVDLKEAKNWSLDNRKLFDELQINGFSKSVCNKPFIASIYEELSFDKEHITELDPETRLLQNLKHLSLNHNQIEIIANVPQNLQQLSLYSNMIKTIDSKINQEKLIFLGLGFNRLTDEALDKLCISFPNLLSLDLSFNLLCRIDETVESLVKLANLKNLLLKGNPICLLKPYKDYVISQLKVLRYFDQEKIPLKEVPKEKNGQKSPLKNVPSLNSEDEKSREFFVSSNVSTTTLGITIRTLENVSGILLESYQYPEFATNPSLFQSNYWVSFEFAGISFSSKDKPVLFESATSENEKSRIDFEISLKESLPINEETRQAFRRGIVLKLHVSQPIVLLNEETQEKLPKMKPDNKYPETEQFTLGVCLINTLDWMTTNCEKRKQLKSTLFPLEVLKTPEFFFPKDNEKDLIKQFYVAPPEKVEEEDKSKDKKKDPKAKKEPPKKDAKKPPPGKKGAEKEPEKKVVPVLDWAKPERDKVFIDKDNIIVGLKDLLLSISLEIL